MAKITSMVGRFSGTVTFDDNTIGTFHTQFENDNVWSILESESIESLKQISWYDTDTTIWPYWAFIWFAIDALPFMSFHWDTAHPSHQKNINDMVAKLELLFTKDDGTIYPVAIVMEGGGGGSSTFRAVFITTPDLISDATNLSEFKIKIANMFHKVISQVTVT